MPSRRIQIEPPDGNSIGSLLISALPDQREGAASFWHAEVSSEAGADDQQVQLVEETEYRYEFNIEGSTGAAITTSHPEVFRRSTADGRTGRLRIGSYVGTMDVDVFLGEECVGTIGVEVRSRKLNYESEYLWMLRDLAEHVTELIMAAFSVTTWQFQPSDEKDAESLYQRFAFLNAMLHSEVMFTAMSRIITRPHAVWVSGNQSRAPGRGAPGSSRLTKNLVAPGPRVKTRRAVRGLSSVPLRLDVPLQHTTLDNEANRFVKFALAYWLDMVQRVRDGLEELPRRPSRDRGLREVRRTAEALEAWRSANAFKDVSDLMRFPEGDQVLEKAEGYREVYRLFVLSEVAASLQWLGGSDTVYSAGKRDVAALYEYWVYIELARILETLCDGGFQLTSLVTEVHGGLELRLRRGHEHVLSGDVRRFGRQLRVELWFNRTFGSGAVWTRAMRPDCSLRVTDHAPQSSGREVWVHFDAKYRVDGMLGVMPGVALGDDAEAAPDPAAERSEGPPSSAKRADLLKMHAYKDAIRLSSGAYVLYPGGNEGNEFRQYEEILPGLGAFPLRPSTDGATHGRDALREFLSGLLDHLASAATQHERARYWLGRTYGSAPPPAMESPTFPQLERPAADTGTLLGYVKSEEHMSWISRMNLYNLRADRRTGSVGLTGPEVGSEIVVLYGPSLSTPIVHTVEGGPQVLLAQTLRAEDYPDPGGSVYLALGLGERQTLGFLDNLVVEKLLQKHGSGTEGAPCAISWLDVIREMAAAAEAD